MDKDNKKKNFKEHHSPGLTLSLEIMVKIFSNCCVYLLREFLSCYKKLKILPFIRQMLEIKVDDSGKQEQILTLSKDGLGRKLQSDYSSI